MNGDLVARLRRWGSSGATTPGRMMIDAADRIESLEQNVESLLTARTYSQERERDLFAQVEAFKTQFAAPPVPEPRPDRVDTSSTERRGGSWADVRPQYQTPRLDDPTPTPTRPASDRMAKHPCPTCPNMP